MVKISNVRKITVVKPQVKKEYRLGKPGEEERMRLQLILKKDGIMR
jgi:hypothetical protein